MNTPKWLIVHHTGGTDANPKQSTQGQSFAVVNSYHQTRWPHFLSSLGFHIGYHYFIDRDGLVTQGRADTDEGAHTIGKNSESLGICLAGNFDIGVDRPTPAQISSLKDLLIKKSKQYNIPIEMIVPHRTFANKSCYGYSLPDIWARSLVIGTQPTKQSALDAIAVQITALKKAIAELIKNYNKRNGN